MLIELVKKACDNLGLSYQTIDAAGVFLKIDLGGSRFHFCVANNLGLNSEVVEKICLDKVYTHDLLSSVIIMPKSTAYIDPNPPEIFLQFVQFRSHLEIVADILAKNQFPLILKPNGKSMGINVFLCKTRAEVENAVTAIFNKNSYKYDHVLLVQEHIRIQKEFRVVVYNRTVRFVYQKDNTTKDAEYEGNISPLHFKNAKAVLLDESKDAELLANIGTFVQPIFDAIDLRYAGLDIALDDLGHLYLLEINTKPGFTYFVRDNTDEKVVTLLEEILTDLR